jgi:hypothetical protein
VNPLLLTICLALVILQLVLPLRWAFLPLLLAACHTPYEVKIAGLTVARIVILMGLLRAAGNGSLRFNLRDSLDRWMIAFVGVALLSSFGHGSLISNPLVFRCGLVLNVFGTYLYARAYLMKGVALEQLGRGLVIVLIPFAFLMVVEKLTGHNPYAAVGVGTTESFVRDGKIRAQGPFGTPILAGTVGACVLPLFVLLWSTRRKLAIIGLASCLIITYSSASSGPISTALLSVGAISLWPLRASIRKIRVATMLLLVILHLIKDRPIWYLMALMDFVGGSTGWHRAYLIDMGIKHMGEWWVCGTDFTSHWMPYSLPTTVPGIYQADLTNYYLHLGVIGGLPLMFCLIAVQWTAFKRLGLRILEMRSAGDAGEFSLWCIGALLFAQCVTFLSISYFDQMYVFFWIVIGGLPAILAEQEEENIFNRDSIHGQ